LATGSSTLINGLWNPSLPGVFVSGSGSGTSVYTNQPSYQKSIVPNSLALANGATSPMRVVPDVALDGDPGTGILTGYFQSFSEGSVQYAESRWGGTSLAAPLMAGMRALLEQRVGHPIGLANPLLYSMDKAGGYNNGTFRDIVAPPKPLAYARANYANSVDNSAA